MDTTKLSYVSIFIAIGTLVVLSLVIFAKRQIMRFSIRSARRPHLPTGHSASQELQEDIHQWLERISDINIEPRLIHSNSEMVPSTVDDSGITCHYKYRMLALDALSTIDVTINKHNERSLRRANSARLRHYLINLHNIGCLSTISLDLIRKFSDLYDHARHMTDPFGQSEYEDYIEQLQLITACLDGNLRRRPGAIGASPMIDTHVQMSGRASADIVTLPVIRQKKRLIIPRVQLPADKWGKNRTKMEKPGRQRNKDVETIQIESR